MKNSSDIILGSFIGDSLALGPHWIYSQDEIKSKLGRVSIYHPPMATYHSGKIAGDFTHYGDQALVLLGSVAVTRRFDLESFASDWKSFWEAPGNISYQDGATRSTLANLKSGSAPDEAGSTSHDIAGAARIAPLFLLPWESDEELLEAVRSQTGLTHRDPQVVEAAEFFARVVLAVRGGMPIREALENSMVARAWNALPKSWLDAANRSAASTAPDAQALEELGLACGIANAFPGICHLLLRHPENPATALIENASAGGDSAARGMILGMVYGAATPVSEWPAEWSDGLKDLGEITELIKRLL